MKRSTVLVLVLCALAGVAAARVADEVPSTAQPRVGEMRFIAVAPNNESVVAELHHDGWLEARGQLLATSSFPELFKVIGRAWTADGAAENRFAIPEVVDRFQRRESSRNPFGVLGPGDMVTSGRTTEGPARTAPLTCWMFVGRPVSAVNATAAGQS
jgi:hypothetical protein